MTAPNNSEKPAIKVYRKAFLKLLVEKYIGIAIDIPSGILCKAIAIANFIPKVVFEVVEIKVVIPSGILCNIKTIIEIIPSLYSLLSGTTKSIELEVKKEITIPTTTKIKDIKNKGNSKNLSFSNSIASGIKEQIDIESITPLEKAKVKATILSLYFLFRKQGITPSKVEKPAKDVVIKLNIILFILQNMRLSIKYVIISTEKK